MSGHNPIDRHTQELKNHYEWLLKHMPSSFKEETILLEVAHHLADLDKQEGFILSHLKDCTLAIAIEAPHLDLKILSKASIPEIHSYESFVSNCPLPDKQTRLYVAILRHAPFPKAGHLTADKELLQSVLSHYPEVSKAEFEHVEKHLSAHIAHGLNKGEIEELLHLIARSLIRDHLQFYLDDHYKLIFSWKNVPKNHFLSDLAALCDRHHLSIDHFTANFIALKNEDDLLVMQMHLKKTGEFHQEDFLKELCFLKFGRYRDPIYDRFVKSHLLTGNESQLLHAMMSFSHQFLVYADSNVYSIEHIKEGALRYPELVVQIVKIFHHKFDPSNLRHELYEKEKNHLLLEIQKIDSGNPSIDTRRKNVLKTLILFTEYCLKTNFYRDNKCALSFRIDPEILNYTPYDRSQKFPELPFGIFFITNKNFIGFHIRFKDLARGGLRTVALGMEQTTWEVNNVFFECYNLAYTQQKKNKDIPEGGAKAIIFVNIHPLAKEEHPKNLEAFRWQLIYESQRVFIHSFLTLINCFDSGELKAKNVIDYYQKPEYVYLGPDENMHNSMIDWIADTSERVGYKPKKAFISSKPLLGINHKEFGITSFGLHTNLKVVMDELKMDPKHNPFTIKISGGPDGDVAGNELVYLHREFPKTAKIIAITDGTGTIRDLEGLSHKALLTLFDKGEGIKHYPKELLSKGSFLLDITDRKEVDGTKDFQRLVRNEHGKIIETHIPASEASQLFRMNMMQVEADIFIPAGGRPRTLNQNNIQDFLNPHGKPTARGIIEGANLYLTPEARHVLEQKGVILIKDSSSNKGGVVCSSFEVLCGLILSDEEFLHHKKEIVQQILDFIESIALKETRLILRTHKEFNVDCAVASDMISEKINFYSYQILDHLRHVTLSTDPNDPLNQCLFAHCLPILRKHQDRLIHNIPDVHKKAIIACFIGSNTIYERGLGWEPSITEILPKLISSLLK